LTTRRIRSWGRAAERAVGADGRVIAAFERSVYVETPRGLACLGEIENGPLNATLDQPLSGLTVGLAVECRGGTLCIGDRVTLSVAGALQWHPPPAPSWHARTMCDALKALATIDVPQDGFAPLIPGLSVEHSAPSPSDNALHRRAAPALMALREWARNGGGAPVFLDALAGLGPGLTPSGDDAVGGAMVAARSFGFGHMADAIAATVRAWPAETTSAISRAHLDAAMQGEAMAALHDALAALGQGDIVAIARATHRLGTVGHSSGWDALAGAVTMLAGLAARGPAMLRP
jgi:hypothetical protein